MAADRQSHAASERQVEKIVSRGPEGFEESFVTFAGLPFSQQPSNLPGKRECPTCRGTGINPVWITKVCPKCNGERTVPVGR